MYARCPEVPKVKGMEMPETLYHNRRYWDKRFRQVHKRHFILTPNVPTIFQAYMMKMHQMHFHIKNENR